MPTEASSTEERMKLSLWLLPPPPQYDELSSTIQRIAKKHNLSTFDPHVTVVGGIECSGRGEAARIAERLRENLRNFGGIPCKFRAVQCPLDVDGDITWNQSCLAPMETDDKAPWDDKFLNAVLLAKRAFDAILKEPVSIEFKPPLRAPHFSYAYGHSLDVSGWIRECETISPPPYFVAREACLYWTYPSKLEGVSSWEKIDGCEISLC